MAHLELATAAPAKGGDARLETATPLAAAHRASPNDDDRTRSRLPSRAHHIGFWVTAAAFLVSMGFSAVPTPLYVLYQQRDHFSDLTVTIVYAVYAVGVVASLFLGGHLSDWLGRRRIFVLALVANVGSAVIFRVLGRDQPMNPMEQRPVLGHDGGDVVLCCLVNPMCGAYGSSVRTLEAAA